jgi:site-specific recombinase XerD
VSELVNLKLSDIDFTSHEITVRQGKGRKDRVVPLVKQAEAVLKAYLKGRDALPEYDEVFIARNGTSMDVRTVRYRIHKYYKEAGIRKKASVHTLRHYADSRTMPTRTGDSMLRGRMRVVDSA